jgi:class 3 adenylate cyclase
MKREMAAILFSDVAGYSKLTEPQLRDYLKVILPDIAALISNHRESLIELNTWGDAVVAVSADPYVLARMALELRDFFRNRNWADDHLPTGLSSRVALHAGVVFTGDDPIRQVSGLVGTQVNLAARIEPITTPGEVWVTEQFMKQIDTASDITLAFDDLGERPLAKKFGSAKLFRLRRQHETTPAPQDIQPEHILANKPLLPKELDIAIHMAKHGTEDQRKAGLDLLDQFNCTEAISTLIETARNKSNPHELRRMAIASLDNLKSRATVLDLIAIVDDQDEVDDIVGSAVEALASIRDVRALPAFERLLLGQRKVEAAAVRATITAISRIADPAGLSLLRKLFEQLDIFRPFIDLIIQATKILTDPSFVAPLQDILNSTDVYSEDTRIKALQALIVNSPSQSEELFIRVATDSSQSKRMQSSALGALAAVPSPKSREVLESIAADLANPLAARALIIMVKGAELLKKQKEDMLKAAKGEID